MKSSVTQCFGHKAQADHVLQAPKIIPKARNRRPSAPKATCHKALKSSSQTKAREALRLPAGSMSSKQPHIKITLVKLVPSDLVLRMQAVSLIPFSAKVATCQKPLKT